MPLEIPLLPLTLLVLVILAAFILSLRSPEGYRIKLGLRFRAKSQANKTYQFYDAFSDRQPQLVRVSAKANGRQRAA